MPSNACYYSSSTLQHLSNTDNDFPSPGPSFDDDDGGSLQQLSKWIIAHVTAAVGRNRGGKRRLFVRQRSRGAEYRVPILVQKCWSFVKSFERSFENFLNKTITKIFKGLFKWPKLLRTNIVAPESGPRASLRSMYVFQFGGIVQPVGEPVKRQPVGSSQKIQVQFSKPRISLLARTSVVHKRGLD